MCLLFCMKNSKEISAEIYFPSFCRKILMSAFLLRFKDNDLEKMRGYPHFFFVDLLFPHGPNLAQKPLYLSTVLNFTKLP